MLTNWKHRFNVYQLLVCWYNLFMVAIVMQAICFENVTEKIRTQDFLWNGLNAKTHDKLISSTIAIYLFVLLSPHSHLETSTFSLNQYTWVCCFALVSKMFLITSGSNFDITYNLKILKNRYFVAVGFLLFGTRNHILWVWVIG